VKNSFSFHAPLRRNKNETRAFKKTGSRGNTPFLL
jgi:hypothetical protein